jgi:hypothetical protein
MLYLPVGISFKVTTDPPELILQITGTPNSFTTGEEKDGVEEK